MVVVAAEAKVARKGTEMAAAAMAAVDLEEAAGVEAVDVAMAAGDIVVAVTTAEAIPVEAGLGTAAAVAATAVGKAHPEECPAVAAVEVTFPGFRTPAWLSVRLCARRPVPYHARAVWPVA